MRLSQYFLPLLRENPDEAQIVSHRLMLRAGMVRQSSAGIYSWLPLGFKVLELSTEPEAVLGRIAGTTDLDGADLDADLVVESVAEDVAAKRRLYQAIEPRLGPATILGTCTSSLSLAQEVVSYLVA